MAQPDGLSSEPPPSPLLSKKQGFLQKFFGRQSGSLPSTPSELPTNPDDEIDDPSRPGMLRRMSRKVVPGLPRAQTFKRQQSESRAHLAPVEPTTDERRAVSVDRRAHVPGIREPPSNAYNNPRTSAPGFFGSLHHDDHPQYVPSLPVSPVEHEIIDEKLGGVLHDADRLTDDCAMHDAGSIMTDTHSMTTSQYDTLIHNELETIWILNLSMHFRDRSKREKFFVTYREHERMWRRVTVSLDYREAPMPSLEMDLIHTKFQRDKNAKIYEAIRESLADIQFYDTVTNLKLQTTDGRLHVHVVEDGNEIIPYPTVSQFQHLVCPRVREQDIVFDSHMSGFVYKVSVHGQVFVKKEIPSPDTIEEFIYEVNALSRLQYSGNVIQFYGIVVDDHEEYVKGLLISYADQGPLVDIIYDHCKESNFGLPWATKEQWAHQIVQGLSDIHESGFVQGDFTLSNIVIDDMGHAKIIDINRRGCPVGWEPPEATPLIESGQRISMYIGVKSDLFQLGMVLWALAMEEDEPDLQERPLVFGPEVSIPDWYREMTEICLSDEPRMRLQASSLLRMFPPIANGHDGTRPDQPPMTVDDGYSLQEYLVDGYHDGGHPLIRTVEPPNRWSSGGRTYADADPSAYEPYYYTRGRSPPSPLPSNIDRCESPRGRYNRSAWAANRNIPPSYSDVGADEVSPEEVPQHTTPTPTADRGGLADSGGLDEPGVIVEMEPDREVIAEDVERGGEATPTGVKMQDSPPSMISEQEASKPDDQAVPGPAYAEAEAGTTDVQNEGTGSDKLLCAEHAVTGTHDAIENVQAVETEESKKLLDAEYADTGAHVTTEDVPDPSAKMEEQEVELPALPPELPEDICKDNLDINGAVGVVDIGELTTAKTDQPLGIKEQLAADQNSKPGPEQSASRMPGDTVPDAQGDESTDLAASASEKPDTVQSTDNPSSTAAPPVTPKATDPAMVADTGSPSIQVSTVTMGSPRDAKLPDSLAGIGSGLGAIDDESMREASILEDFDAAKRAGSLPATIITTDADT